MSFKSLELPSVASFCQYKVHLLGALFVSLAGLPAWADSITTPASYASLRGVPDAISADGTTVVGINTFASGNNAFRSTLATGTLTDLGTLGGHGLGQMDYVDADGTSSEAWAVNANGSVVVGTALTTANLAHAFRWTTAGMVDLGTLGGSTSAAYGVNASGSVVVGAADLTGNRAQHAFRWTSSGMSDLGTLGGTNSSAQSVSGDGNVVVGYSNLRGDATTNAFRWTATGMTNLGNLGGTLSTAQATNSDGSVVVGYADLAGVFRPAKVTPLVG